MNYREQFKYRIIHTFSTAQIIKAKKFFYSIEKQILNVAKSRGFTVLYGIRNSEPTMYIKNNKKLVCSFYIVPNKFEFIGMFKHKLTARQIKTYKLKVRKPKLSNIFKSEIEIYNTTTLNLVKKIIK